MTWVTLCCTCNLLPHTDHCVASCAQANAQLSLFAECSSLVGCQANGANPPSDQRLSTRQVSQALERVHHHHVLPWWTLPHYAALACAGGWKLKRSGLFGRATARVVGFIAGEQAATHSSFPQQRLAGQCLRQVRLGIRTCGALVASYESRLASNALPVQLVEPHAFARDPV